MFKTYNNTLIELKNSQKRLKYLQEKKEELFSKFILPKSMTIDNVGGTHQAVGNDNVNRYVIAVNSGKDGEMSINEEIEFLHHQINRLTILLEQMTDNLIQLKGIESELFIEIVVKGNKPSEAVKVVAERRFMTENNVWITYYPKVKEMMKELKQ